MNNYHHQQNPEDIDAEHMPIIDVLLELNQIMVDPGVPQHVRDHCHQALTHTTVMVKHLNDCWDKPASLQMP